ncbi:MAG: hypothetical protein A2020_00425 [Lentisphaerae bacterium GWF2_45_14]|nr:MAG: hypothetical protein A2020_00425 [Lentisphaerae bacterium GWF2_45_14]
MTLTDKIQKYSKVERKKFYEQQLLLEMPRLLSRLCRCPLSVASGSFDREYWAWATKDFSNCDEQRTLLVLAYLYKTEFPRNIYHKEKAVLQWFEASVDFCIKNQSRHGAFDHLYKNEESWMAAAFLLLDMLEAYNLVSKDISPSLSERWKNAMSKMGDFLSRNDENHGFISNHRAAGAAALLGLSRLLGQDRFKARAIRIMKEIHEHQAQEGWYDEYGGADPGYQTLDTHYQARFCLYAENENEYTSSVARSIEFLSYFIHPDGSIGGDYGSRACPHFFPGGFEYFAADNLLAEKIASICVAGLAAGTSCGLADADPRNAAPMITSYVYAHQALFRNTGALPEEVLLPFEKQGIFAFPDAGFATVSNSAYYSIFGASKGGVVKIFDKASGRLIFSSCGYAGKMRNGKHLTTLLYTRKPSFEIKEGSDENNFSMSVHAPFFFFKTGRLMGTLGMIAFRLFSISVGRFRAFSDFVRKHLIIGIFLKARKKAPAALERKFEFSGSGFAIEDFLTFENGSNSIEQLSEYGHFSAVYMASANYFRKQDLLSAFKGDELIAPDFRENVKQLKKSRIIPDIVGPS